MVLCFAADCNHRTVKNECSFFRFPKDAKLKAVWTKLSRRADREPGPDSRLCSCHFKDKKKENGPSIFSRNEKKYFDFPSIPKQRKKQKIVTAEASAVPILGFPSSADVELLRAENDDLKKRVVDLEIQLKQNQLLFHFEHIRKNNDHVLLYTGLPNCEIFDVLLNYCKRFEISYYYSWSVTCISFEDQLFITLQKLRQNYTFVDLGVRYSVSEKTIRNVFFTFLHVLHEILFEFIICDMKNIPSLHKVQAFGDCRKEFPNCRFLIDCTEVKIENPRSSMSAQRQTYSSYKKMHTFKVLIAITPDGSIAFVSDMYPGAISDKEITRRCKFIEILNPGDLIIADKGFVIHDLLPKGVFLNVPPFLSNPQFTSQEAKFTTVIARARIHVERAIQRIKSFDIVNDMPHDFRPVASKIFQVCATLTNFQNPIIQST